MKLYRNAFLACCSLFLINCSAGESASEQMIFAETSDNANQGLNIEPEPLTPLDQSLPTITEPIEMPGPVAQAPQQVEPQPEPEQSSGGFFGRLFDGISSLFGGGSSSSGNSSGTCSTLSGLLGIGGSLLGGVFGGVLGQLPGLLFNCGGSSNYSNLIPNGSSGQNSIFQFLGSVIQNYSNGQNPLAQITQIQNPNDVSAMVGILQNIIGQTGNNDLNNLLNTFTQYQGFLSGDFQGDCGSMNPEACRVFQLINNIRSNNGLPDFEYSDNCTSASQYHSQDLSLHTILSHLSSNGNSAQQRLSFFDVLMPWGENIIRGNSLTAEQAVDAWMNSDEHRDNILSDVYTTTGVGYVNGYFTQCFARN